MPLTGAFLAIFLLTTLLCSYALTIVDRKAETIAEIEENTIYISCLHLSKSYIKVSKKETETSFSDLNLSQDPLYLKLLALTFSHCLKNLKFEETFEVIKKKNEFLGFFYKFNKFNMNK